MQYICINCSRPLPHLYTTYSKADDRSLGKGVRLTQCPNCKRFADKYVEHDYVVLFIDLVLIKPQVYRHLLFNRLTPAATSQKARTRLDPSILRLGILLVLFDVYITWARIEKGNATDQPGASVLTSWPILSQYLFFLTLNVVATLAQHFTIRGLAYALLRKSQTESEEHASPEATDKTHSRQTSAQEPLSAVAHDDANEAFAEIKRRSISGSAISTAILVSSCTKLFPILLVIWPTTSGTETSTENSVGPFASRAASYIGWVVLANNIEALLILLDCGYLLAAGLATAGMVTRYLIEGWLLAAVGLQRDDGGPVGDLMRMTRYLYRGCI